MSLMKRLVCLFGLLAGVLCPLCAQDWTPEDSLRLQRLLEGDGEIKLNPQALKELEQSFGQPKASEEKSWLRFDETLPGLPTEKQKKARLVLRPYTGYTPYNWDPIRQCKIDIDKPTWQENILRPKYLGDFQGQQSIKDNLSVFIKAARDRGDALDHTFIVGPPGLGKTTLASIIANEMHSEIRMTSAPALDKPKDLAGILTNVSEGSIFFALRGDNFDGNAYASKALEQGCAYAVVDEEQYAVKGDPRYILVKNSLDTMQQLAHLRAASLPLGFSFSQRALPFLFP